MPKLKLLIQTMIVDLDAVGKDSNVVIEKKIKKLLSVM